jgi:hypothetical protein
MTLARRAGGCGTDAWHENRVANQWIAIFFKGSYQ